MSLLINILKKGFIFESVLQNWRQIGIIINRFLKLGQKLVLFHVKTLYTTEVPSDFSGALDYRGKNASLFV